MTDIATATVSGRMTRDAELKQTRNGSSVLNGSIASNYSVKRGDDWDEEASFFDFVVFGRRAEALAKYLVKGKQVVVRANLRQDRWETDDGQKRSRVKLYAQEIVLAGGSGGSQQSSSSNDDVDFDDDIPF